MFVLLIQSLLRSTSKPNARKTKKTKAGVVHQSTQKTDHCNYHDCPKYGVVLHINTRSGLPNFYFHVTAHHLFMGSSSNHNIFVFISWQRSYTRNSLSKLKSNFIYAPSSWEKIKEKIRRKVMHVSLPKETIRPQNLRQNRNGVQMISMKLLYYISITICDGLNLELALVVYQIFHKEYKHASLSCTQLMYPYIFQFC